eukprot:s3225_g3.t1
MAYLPLRGCEDSISRVREHCAAVRKIVIDNQFKIHQSARNHARSDVAGGVVVSLDSSKAFDHILRSKLYEALRSLQVEEHLIALLMTIYSHTTFSFQHRQQHRVFPVNKGIRQGCKAAPILWCCFVAHVLHQTASAINFQWIVDFLTAFADDFCLHCLFDSSADVHAHLRNIGCFLDILHAADLTVNMSKTVAIFKIVGPGTHPLLKRYVKRTKTGTFLQIPSKRADPYLIRLVPHFTYLGIVLSYSHFELLTVRHRIKAGIQVAHQLHRWLHKQTGFSSFQKTKLWFQCVFPCLTYGLRAVGWNFRTLQMLDRTMIGQLRRIFRSPVHLTHLSHSDFLEHFGITDPLQQLLHQCHTAAERDTQRRSQLTSDDIIHQIPPVNHPELCQVIADVLDSRRHHSDWNEVMVPEHCCIHCSCSFSTLAALRRHVTLVHERRTGLLRLPIPADVFDGVPTCARCGKHFTRWHNLYYHLSFVCTDLPQELDETEHRLRVQEFLQYARGLQFLALGQQQDLTSYFMHRCILCGKYVVSNRGMIAHWEHDHVDSFRKHGEWHDFLQHQLDLSNPCTLCGIHYQRMHQCLILRQYALYLAHLGQMPPRAANVTQQTFPCPRCSKVYMTRHGLDQHLRRYHRAVQVGQSASDLNAEQLVAHCLAAQAVESNSCESLLEDENVVALLSSTCLVCQHTFRRKQELSRHLKSNHSHWWHQCTTEASRLELQHKPVNTCFCIPPIYNRKHLCLPFLQFTMMRIHLGHAPDAQAGLQASPDMLLSSQEIVTQLAWLVMLAHLLLLPALKLTLSLHCQVCGSTFATTELLAGHLKSLHANWLEDAEEIVHLLNWALFGTYGCFCNPVTPHDTVGHQCTTLLQLAVMLQRSGPAILIPWSYRATELIDFLDQLLPAAVLAKVTRLMLTRRFEDVMFSYDVYQLLTHRCLWCHEEVSLSQMRAHILAFHHFDSLTLNPITHQLAVQAAHHHSDGWYCDYCQELLPSDQIDLDIFPVPLRHLRDCEYLRLVATMLSFPVWHRPSYEMYRWPLPDEAADARQQLNLQRAQFNVGPSDDADTFGLSYEPLAACGLTLLHDPHFADTLGHQCLFCNAVFFSPWKFMQHISNHNYRQLDTYMCYHRLQLRCSMHCQFCGLADHLPSLAGICLHLFHLAVWLSNGSPGTDGSSSRYLGWASQPCADGSSGPLEARQRLSQASSNDQEPVGEAQRIQGFLRRLAADGSQTCTAHRGLDQSTSSRSPIRDPHASRSGIAPAGHVGCVAGMAPGRPGDAFEASAGGPDDHDAPRALGELVEEEGRRSGLGGEHAVPHSGFSGSDALLEVGCQEQNLGAIEGGQSPHGSGDQVTPGTAALGAGQLNHLEVPLAGEDHNRSPGSLHPLAVDDQLQEQPRSLERGTQTLLSQFLAIHPLADQTPGDRTKHLGQEHPQGALQRSVRILVNPGNMCYVNSFLISLSWVVLLTDMLDPQWWPGGGFELFRNLTQQSVYPLNLATFAPFTWLLGPGWTIDDLAVQQDVAEFGHWFLHRTRPFFIDCRWVARYLRDVGPEELRDGAEKGALHSPIQLPIHSGLCDSCQTNTPVTLQSLIDAWHDPLGLCRSTLQAGRTILVEISRFLPEMRSKCLQQIEVTPTVRFPSFCNDEGDTHFYCYDVCAFVYHIGATPHTGHYRAALRYQQHWLVYEDSQPPEHVDQLPTSIQSNITLLWLLPSSDLAARTLMHREIVPRRVSSPSSDEDECVMADTDNEQTDL